MNVLLFVASPGDVAERHGPVDQVAAQFNATLGHNLEATLKIIRWETDAPRGPAERPQGAINPLLDQSDIMLGIFWRRCGTPSGVAASGTIEEYTRALDSWRTRGHPIPLLYFCEAPAPPPKKVAEAEQLVQVARIREAAGRDALIGAYETTEAFTAVLSRDLYRIAAEVIKVHRLPIERGLAFSLLREREACHRADRPFHTPSLLTALLRRPTGLLRLALERLEPGLAYEILAWMEKAEDQLSSAPEHTFEPFEWLDRHDFTAALERATVEGQVKLGERHLASAVLAGAGSTVSALRRRVGAEGFDRLVTLVETNAASPGYGTVFDDTGTET